MYQQENSRPSHPDQTVILVVDDEVMVQNVARITLEADGYFILTAHDGEEALHLSRKFRGTIHAVLSDVMMPTINGLQLREQILRERPGIKVLLMSGHVDAQPPSDVPFLAKPFDPPVLIERMRQPFGICADHIKLTIGETREKASIWPYNARLVDVRQSVGAGSRF